jgi:LPXTG-site transpeptidase (sortase) family protein
MQNMRVEIPRINVDVSVMGVPFGGPSGWDLTWLGSNAGYLAGTAYPGWEGNSALTGHVYLPNGQPGPFVNLHTLVWGDQIILHANGERYVYEVRQVLRTWAGDLSPLAHEDQAWLTLLTCQGYNEDTDAYIWRIAVRAVLVEVTPE